MKIREAPFAIRVVRRSAGDAAIIYRRSTGNGKRDSLVRIAALSPLPFLTGGRLLREAARKSAPDRTAPTLVPGPWIPLDADWGARVACYAMIAEGLRDPERLQRASDHLLRSDATEAAWWLGLMSAPGGNRAVRALRILVEAVA